MTQLKQTERERRTTSIVVTMNRYKGFDVVSPISVIDGGKPENAVMDVWKHVAQNQKRYSLVIVDSFTTQHDEALVSASDDSGGSGKELGSFKAPQRTDYMLAQGNAASDLWRIMKSMPKQFKIPTITTAHTETVYEDEVWTNSKGERQTAKKPWKLGFGMPGQKYIEKAMRPMHPGMIHLEVIGQGGSRIHRAHFVDWKVENMREVVGMAKWRSQHPDFLQFVKQKGGVMNVSGRENIEAMWRRSVEWSGGGFQSFRVGIAGPTYSGKTTVATTLWPEFWKDEPKVLYFGCDPGADELDAVVPADLL